MEKRDFTDLPSKEILSIVICFLFLVYSLASFFSKGNSFYIIKNVEILAHLLLDVLEKMLLLGFHYSQRL